MRAVNSIRPAWIVLALFTAGLFNDPPWRGLKDHPQIGFGFEPILVARSLSEHGTFSNPFRSRDTGPTAHLAPVYPFLEFLILETLGSGAAAWAAIQAIPIFALSLQYALLPLVARALGFSIWTGALAGLFGLLTKPGKVEYSESNLAGLAALLLTWMVFAWPRSGRRAWGVGLFAGAVALLQPVSMLVYYAWLAFEARRALVLWFAPVLVCLPWVIRNQVVVGAPLTLRSNLGIEMHVSYNDCTPYGFVESLEHNCIQSLHPHDSLAEAGAIVALGESGYNRDRLRRALAWIREHPHRSLTFLAQRTWYFWFPSEHGLRGYLTQRNRLWILHAVTLASFAGLWLAWKRRIAGARILLLWCALFPLIYYVLEHVTRYRYPMLWVTWLAAAYAVFEAVSTFKTSRTS